MNVTLLQFEPLESQFGRSWLSMIPGFRANYAIWIDRNSGKTIVSDPKGDQSEHTSIDEAKEWCQKDFEEKVKRLIQEC